MTLGIIWHYWIGLVLFFGSIITVLAHVLGIPHERIWRLATAPASLTAVEIWGDGGTSVPFVNDTSHLR